MITEQQLAAMGGCRVETVQGQSVGVVGYFLVDDTTGRPEWARITEQGSGPGGVFVPLRQAVLSDGCLTVPYPGALIEDAPCAGLEPEGVLTVAQEQGLFEHYGIRAVREETQAQGGAGWAEMDRAQAIREGTDGHESDRSRLRSMRSA
ncbi:PRC-barrel domain-containing protein [Streptomyces sp. NPDC090127]|uniref:PRC-barrel domain-containing protein n=1 Tax=Streptomyces sp. NPDC090127 TaxID=3365953 RepID=UPI003829A254